MNHLHASLFLCAVLPAQGIVLRSGQALPGQNDPNVRCLVGPQAGPFGGPFTATDFQSARSGPNAVVLTSIAGGWPTTLPSDPTPRWINSPANSTALYAIDFTPTGTWTSARFAIEFVADDYLGVPGSATTTAVDGIYVNGVAVPYSAGIGNYYQATVYETLDIAPHLVAGTNTLYLYLNNTGGRAGLLFRAELATDRAAVQGFGSGCTGSVGKPNLLLRSGRPALGTNLLFELYGVPATGSAVIALGASRQFWLAQPLPVDLTPFGLTGCSTFVSLDDFLPTINLGGVSWVGFTLPNVGVLLGLQIYMQGLVADPLAGNPASATMSNALGLLFGY